jgi:hypothetical protein
MQVALFMMSSYDEATGRDLVVGNKPLSHLLIDFEAEQGHYKGMLCAPNAIRTSNMGRLEMEFLNGLALLGCMRGHA